MGEVYRARDTKLHRDVALKVLPAAVAADSERVARFEREAHVLAALNHPNIAQIFGVEDTGGPSAPLDSAQGAVSASRMALVMELVDGETLADRIARGPIDPAEALPIALQIAHALEAAHDQGIVHRDLKPANVKIRGDGTAKVLDFGLAKALGAGTSDAPPDVLDSPTHTSPARLRQGFGEAGTEIGVILGTAAYMSPEQAKGRAVDKRADIWAFGVVLFEMLTGRALFAGDSVVETIGFVATRDPDWSSLPETTPAAVRRLLRRCLTRDPNLRLRDIGEARIALVAADEPVASATVGPPPEEAITGRRVRPVAAVAGLAIALLVFLTGWYVGTRSAAAPGGLAAPLQVEIVPTPPDAFARFASQRQFAFTPDGQALIYASTDPEARLLYRRDRSEAVAVPIAGSEGAYGPFVSPDSAWIGFFADGKLKRVPASGGAVQTVHDMRAPTAPDALGMGWGNEIGPAREIGFGGAFLGTDTIVYGRLFGGLWRIPAAGGTPSPLTTLASEGEIAHRLPHALPGGRAILFTAARGILANQGTSVDAWDLATGTRTTVVPDATDGRYAPGGRLFFARNAALYSIAFDAATLKTSGEPVRVAGDIRHAVGGGAPGRASGAAQYDVSPDGIVALLPGGAPVMPQRSLVWMTRGGATEPLGDAAAYLAPRLSPDGTRIVTMSGGGVVVIGIRDGIPTPLTKGATFPIWLHDGSSVLAARREANVRQDIYRYSLSGGAPQPVVSSQHTLWPSSVSRDGKYLVYVESNPKTGNDIWAMELGAPDTAAPVVDSPANETHPAFSPDGRWLVYAVEDGDASGLYVRRFPGPGRGERITRGAAGASAWIDNRTILYETPAPDAGAQMYRLMRLTIDAANDRVAIGSTEVFATARFGSSTPVGGFDVAADGRVLTPLTPPATTLDTPPARPLQLIVPANLAGRVR